MSQTVVNELFFPFLDARKSSSCCRKADHGLCLLFGSGTLEIAICTYKYSVLEAGSNENHFFSKKKVSHNLISLLLSIHRWFRLILGLQFILFYTYKTFCSPWTQDEELTPALGNVPYNCVWNQHCSPGEQGSCDFTTFSVAVLTLFTLKVSVLILVSASVHGKSTFQTVQTICNWKTLSFSLNIFADI